MKHLGYYICWTCHGWAIFGHAIGIVAGYIVPSSNVKPEVWPMQLWVFLGIHIFVAVGYLWAQRFFEHRTTQRRNKS